MSDERQETIADVVAAMRDESHAGDGCFLEWVGEKMRSYADRIEAAAKREREAGAEAAQICGEIGDIVGREAACHQPVTDCHGLNAAAMREALENVRFYLPHFLQYMRLHCEDAEAGGYYEKILEVVNSALSAPPRNFDVGTSDEQAKRFHSYCKKFQSDIQGMCSHLCPCINCCDMCHCITKWAKMPYEEGDAE